MDTNPDEFIELGGPAASITHLVVRMSRDDVRANDREAPFCSECGQLLGRHTRELSWQGAAHPWWAWGLIALGAALVIAFGSSAWYAAQEQAATLDALGSLPARENRLEGPSVQLAYLRAGAPPGLVDRYLFANQQLSRALVETKLALAMVLFGISLVARPAAMRWAEGFLTSSNAITRASLCEPALHALFNGWALLETVVLAAFRLLTIAYLYLLIEHVDASGPPTVDVLHETLDRVIQVVTMLPDLAR